MKSAILFVVEGGIQVSRCVGVSSLFGAVADRAFRHTDNALTIGTLRAYRKSG
jgi:hypothetical protein